MIEIARDALDAELGIAGLYFAPNALAPLAVHPGWFDLKVM